MSLPAPAASSETPVRRSRLLLAGLAAYFVLALAAWSSGRAWLAALAVFVLASALLSPALRRRSAGAWGAWLALALLLGLLAVRGEGLLALDALPILVNAALCALFASTLRDGREPLIARFIAIIESRERLAVPRVAAYARQLTWAWALLLGAQASALGVVLCLVPGGVFAAFGATSPAAFAAPGWRWYLHVGGYALVPLVLVLEYAYRRVHLRGVPHAPLPLFIARVVQRWPALLQGIVADAGDTRPTGVR
ncbi:MAG: xanthomonadin biosynthesis protein [Dokdonella sp.]|uniref:xanthomonadin biosynthesis protein n=1 Tax=Dokdonella sp. TaxID=2291710 RepID=UPI003F7D1882